MTPDRSCNKTEKEEESSIRREVAESAKIRLPVPRFQDSDTEDEEVIISGNMRSRHLRKAMTRVKKQ